MQTSHIRYNIVRLTHSFLKSRTHTLPVTIVGLMLYSPHKTCNLHLSFLIETTFQFLRVSCGLFFYVHQKIDLPLL